MPSPCRSSLRMDVVASKYTLNGLKWPNTKGNCDIMSELQNFMEEVKDEIRIAPKMFRQLQKRDELIKTLKQQRDDLLAASIEAKMLLETDPRYPGFEDCDCGRCTICKIKAAITQAKP